MNIHRSYFDKGKTLLQPCKVLSQNLTRQGGRASGLRAR